MEQQHTPGDYNGPTTPTTPTTAGQAGTPAVDPRDARIAELEDELRDRDGAEQQQQPSRFDVATHDELAAGGDDDFGDDDSSSSSFDPAQLVRVDSEDHDARGAYGFVVGSRDVEQDARETNPETGKAETVHRESTELTVALLGGGVVTADADQLVPVEG